MITCLRLQLSRTKHGHWPTSSDANMKGVGDVCLQVRSLDHIMWRKHCRGGQSGDRCVWGTAWGHKPGVRFPTLTARVFKDVTKLTNFLYCLMMCDDSFNCTLASYRTPSTAPPASPGTVMFVSRFIHLLLLEYLSPRKYLEVWAYRRG